MPATPTKSQLRDLIAEVLYSDSDFDAFVLDNFEGIYRRFSNGMDRVVKVSLLLVHGDAERIFKTLMLDQPAPTLRTLKRAYPELMTPAEMDYPITTMPDPPPPPATEASPTNDTDVSGFDDAREWHELAEFAVMLTTFAARRDSQFGLPYEITPNKNLPFGQISRLVALSRLARACTLLSDEEWSGIYPPNSSAELFIKWLEFVARLRDALDRDGILDKIAETLYCEVRDGYRSPLMGFARFGTYVDYNGTNAEAVEYLDRIRPIIKSSRKAP